MKAKHAATAFSGEGAAQAGGRWNSRNVAVVYASDSKALAALETLVHLNPPVMFQYVVFQVGFEASLIEDVPVRGLPADWRGEPPGAGTRGIGDAWAREARSAVLAVPSVIVSGATNYVFNPAHRDFRRLVIDPPEPFAFDPRSLA
ncbi:MAG: RES domain-containing protein [Verrucomicrobiales bacterium]|nr:RES domain-containing protein [Verrucomicrobiales bacterium]MCP5528419.1 RES domain-containing protein [Verrucomicrobiales bacterium]